MSDIGTSNENVSVISDVQLVQDIDDSEYLAVSSSDASAEFIEETSPQTSIKDYLGTIDRDSDKLVLNESYTSDETVGAQLDFNNLLFKGYVFDTYIIMEEGDSLYVFDQHAAHERIFYEKLIGIYNSTEKLRQALLTPMIINVSADVYELKNELLEALESIGYDIGDFGAGSFIIREIPSFMNTREANEFAVAFCDSPQAGGYSNSTVIDKLIMKSCKSAVKGGDRLSEIEISSLMDDLSSCTNPYSCPHGRPTFIKITKYDAERAFKRK